MLSIINQLYTFIHIYVYHYYYICYYHQGCWLSNVCLVHMPCVEQTANGQLENKLQVLYSHSI